MTVIEPEAVSEAQREQIPPVVRKAIRTYAHNVESIERFQSEKHRCGVTFTAESCDLYGILREIREELDSVRPARMYNHDEEMTVQLRYK